MTNPSALLLRLVPAACLLALAYAFRTVPPELADGVRNAGLLMGAVVFLQIAHFLAGLGAARRA
jgi:hypothetical protein